MAKDNNCKKICMIAMASYPGDPRIRRQAEALEQAGYEVDVLCRYSGKQAAKEKIGHVTAYRIMNAPSRESKFLYFLQSIVFVAYAFIRLLLLSLSKRYKVIQAHNLPDYLIFAGILHKMFGVKLILDIHDPSVDLFEDKWPGKKNRPLKFILSKLEQYSCKLADELITVSDTCKDRLVQRGNSPDKITLVLNTANENLFKFNSIREFRKITNGARLIYHGTISERFGLHNVISAMPILLMNVPGSIFNIYGKYEDEYLVKLKNLISDLNLSKNVKLNDKISLEQIPDLINNHDIGIVPYLQTDYMNLALPTKAFEYIATGVPVISTKLKDLYETFGDNCITYLEDSDPQEIADSILFICSSPSLAKSRVNEAYQKLSDISGIVMRNRYISLYDNLILE
ncbi:MAG TPA: glycosyltransferase family 4 protein [Ignavibacteriaceae bacterium]|nr:glycosyltransferase family 4 protein [Ignavibacteriaceae bacterium]